MDGFGVVLLLLAIFVLPEINNIFKKKKKYQYPDETQSQQDDTLAGTEKQKRELNINWDEIFGIEEPIQLETKTLDKEEAVPEIVPVTEEISRVRVKEKDQQTNHEHEKQTKITARQALQGMIMAEIISKPRAMRPVEKLGFYSNRKNKIS
ncbi:hypothetical protein [Succinispira mobilis]|uniref:hypothetical protein n=1 Tax=Succinispira mobilis TaxID=78120 RepID=UPI000361C34B|nr:hypothetical protein [Succinispira mobilis]